FVIPRFFDRGTFDARSLGDEAQSMVRYAQKLAVARNGRIYVCATSNGISLGTDSSCGQTDLMPAGRFLSHNGLSITPVATFYFDALGKPFSTGSAEFVTTQFDLSIGGATQSFSVEKETGYVH